MYDDVCVMGTLKLKSHKFDLMIQNIMIPTFYCETIDKLSRTKSQISDKEIRFFSMLNIRNKTLKELNTFVF